MHIEISKQERGIGNNPAELAKYGYGVLKGKHLIDLKLVIEHQHVNEIDFVNIIPLKEKRLFVGGVEPGMLSLMLFLSPNVIHEN